MPSRICKRVTFGGHWRRSYHESSPPHNPELQRRAARKSEAEAYLRVDHRSLHPVHVARSKNLTSETFSAVPCLAVTPVEEGDPWSIKLILRKERKGIEHDKWRTALSSATGRQRGTVWIRLDRSSFDIHFGKRDCWRCHSVYEWT